MAIEGLHQLSASIIAFLLGTVTSLLSLISPMQEEIPQLLKQPSPTPILTEETRVLSKEEQATMSASFIREFEMMQSSGSGERK